MSFVFSSILPTLKMYSLIEQDEQIEFKSILKTFKCKILPIMEVDESENASKSVQPSYLEQKAAFEASSITIASGGDDIDFEQVNEPLLDIPEATSESIQSPKKLHSRRCKAVESSLDGHYWSVSSTRRRRKSSRVRRQPDFFTPS